MNKMSGGARQWSDLPLVLTTTEVAEVLRLQRQTVTRMLVAGRLHGVKTGKDWRISRAEVLRFMGEKSPVDALAGRSGDEPTATAEVNDATWADDPLTKLVGAFDGRAADLSRRHHEYYAEAIAARALNDKVAA